MPCLFVQLLLLRTFLNLRSLLHRPTKIRRPHFVIFYGIAPLGASTHFILNIQKIRIIVLPPK